MEGLNYNTGNIWKTVSTKRWVYHSNERINDLNGTLGSVTGSIIGSVNVAYIAFINVYIHN